MRAARSAGTVASALLRGAWIGFLTLVALALLWRVAGAAFVQGGYDVDQLRVEAYENALVECFRPWDGDDENTAGEAAADTCYDEAEAQHLPQGRSTDPPPASPSAPRFRDDAGTVQWPGLVPLVRRVLLGPG